MKICIHAEKESARTHWEATYANAKEEKYSLIQILNVHLCIFRLKIWLLVSMILNN
jgi:hypothetical protein